MPARLLVAGLVLAHALIHVVFVAPRPPATARGPAWPFSTNDSWLFTRLEVGADATRIVALALVATTIAGFLLAAVCAIGILPAAIWVPAIAIGAVSSLGLLVVFFHPWLAVGAGIDLALVLTALVAGWSPSPPGPGI